MASHPTHDDHAAFVANQVFSQLTRQVLVEQDPHRGLDRSALASSSAAMAASRLTDGKLSRNSSKPITRLKDSRSESRRVRRISGPKQETSPTAAIVRHWCMLKFVKRLLTVVDWTLGELYEFVSYIAEHP